MSPSDRHERDWRADGERRRSDRSAGHVAPQRVVKDAHFVRPSDALQEINGFGIVDALDLVLVPEIPDRASMGQELKPDVVQQELRRRGTKVVDDRRVLVSLCGRPWNSGRRLVGVGDRLLAGGGQIVQGGLNVGQRRGCDLIHGRLPDLKSIEFIWCRLGSCQLPPAGLGARPGAPATRRRGNARWRN